MGGKVLDRHKECFRNADPVDLGVAQFVSLARAANVTIDMHDGRLILRAARMDWKLWRPLRRCLDEVGADRIAAYFKRTTEADRAILSGPA